jgi:hypothetical protein
MTKIDRVTVKGKAMNWERSEYNWKEKNGSVMEQWGDLTELQVASRIQEPDDLSGDDAEPEPAEWEHRLAESDHAA